MHEYSVTQQILKIVEENALKNNAKRVSKIILKVGEDSGFVGESINMYFNIISKGTLSEKALFKVKIVKAQLKCEKCEEYFERRRFSYICPVCGGQGRPTAIGKELDIEALEIEI